MSESGKTVALDTNVLINAINEESLSHTKARKFVNCALEGKMGAVITYQNLTEYYAVVTNPKILARPLTAGEAISEVENLLGGNIKLVFPNRSTEKIWLSILKKKEVIGQEVHDKFLAATLMSNGITRIITENINDFAGIKGLEALSLSESDKSN